MKKYTSSSSSFPDAAAVHAYLDAMPMFSKSGAAAARFGLDGIRELCEALGNPQRTLCCMHVAGTNGKGSVCQMLSAIYSRAGYRTGCFTSPHLLRYNERITLNGQEISDADLLRFFQAHGPCIQRIQPSYFELATALAFWYFADRQVDIAVIETGLGGRLDSTNIVQPVLSIITSIGLDHTEILGESLSEIAAEKAGIIKQKVPVVIGKLPPEARRVVVARAAGRQSPLYEAETLEPEYLGEGRIRLRMPSSLHYKTLQTHLQQAVQRYNVAMVMQAIDTLQKRFPVSPEAAAHAIENARLRARFEQLMPDLPCYFDGAHNPEAFAQALAEVHQKAGSRNKVLVFSMMRDKLNDKMISMLSQFDEIFYFETTSERGAAFRELSQLLPNVKRFNDKEWLSLATRLKKVAETAPAASTLARANAGEPVSRSKIPLDIAAPASPVLVLFSGSLYFYGYVTKLLMRASPELMRL